MKELLILFICYLLKNMCDNDDKRGVERERGELYNGHLSLLNKKQGIKNEKKKLKEIRPS